MSESQEIYEVEKILNKKRARGKNKYSYLIKWVGYDEYVGLFVN